jgi:hypothetical protein
MPAPAAKRDKVKLTRPITVKGHSFAPGLSGTIVYCHGTYCHGAAAYEVAFPEIRDFFQIPTETLAKA